MASNDIEALIRVIALSIANNQDGAEEIVKWAYGGDQKNKERRDRQWSKRQYKDFLRTDIQNISLNTKNEFIRRFIEREEAFPTDEVKSIISQMEYSDFLKTPYWKAIAHYVKDRYDRQCYFCGATKTLQVHHLRYDNHGDEMHHLGDLVCVCKECHKILHNKETGDETSNTPAKYEDVKKLSSLMLRECSLKDQLFETRDVSDPDKEKELLQGLFEIRKAITHLRTHLHK